MEFLKKLKRFKDAVVEVVKEDPETAFLAVSSGAAVGIAIGCFIDISRLNKEVKEVGKAVTNVFGIAQAGYIANNQRCTNLSAQVEHIATHLGIAEECKQIGAETAQAAFNKAGYTHLEASKLVALLDAAGPMLHDYLETVNF